MSTAPYGEHALAPLLAKLRLDHPEVGITTEVVDHDGRDGRIVVAATLTVGGGAVTPVRYMGLAQATRRSAGRGYVLHAQLDALSVALTWAGYASWAFLPGAGADDMPDDTEESAASDTTSADAPVSPPDDPDYDLRIAVMDLYKTDPEAMDITVKAGRPLPEAMGHDTLESAYRWLRDRQKVRTAS